MFEQAASILDELLALPASQRAGALRDMRIDEALRLEVESLLEHDEQDSFLEVGPAGLATTEDSERHPEQIGGYRITRVLGAGGMGVVYEVIQATVGRKAALKVLHDSFIDERAHLRMQLEIEVLGRLEHPGIARIFEAGIDESSSHPRPFFLMEFIDGGPIDQWVRRQDLGPMAIVDLFLQVCDAVQHAHSNGIIHRDLKPENIYVDLAGTPRVLDFGIARPVASDGSLAPATQTGTALLGTLAYMSPEQCSPGTTVVGVRTDVYSLGVVLFELLSGQRPIETQGLSLVQAARCVCETHPTRPSHRGRNLGVDLEGILLRALEKSPDQRYATVAALADDLRRWQQHLPVEARPASPWKHAHAWVVRHPIWATALLCGLIAACSLGLTLLSVWWIGWRPDGVVSYPEQNRARLISTVGRTLKEWRDVHRAEYIQRSGHDVAVVSFQNTGRLQGFHPESPDAPLWKVADLGLKNPSQERLADLQPYANLLQVDDFLPTLDGPEILFVERLSPESPCVIRILDPLGRLRFEVWHNGSVTGAAWHPEQGRIVFCGFLSTPTWKDRGNDLVDHPWPIVAFAIAPADGLVNNDQFVVEDDITLDCVAWYRWIGPVAALRRSGGLRPSLHRAVRDGVYMTTLHLAGFERDPQTLSVRLLDVDVSLYVEPDGSVPHRLPSDEYQAAAARGEYAQADAWRLLDLAELPPVLPERE